MAGYKRLTKRLAVAVAGIVALASSYYYGLTSRPSFQELSPRIQQAVKEEHNAFESLVNRAVRHLKAGDTESALKELKTAESLAKSLAKIDPEYELIWHKINQMMIFFDTLERATGSLETTKIRVGRITIPPTHADVSFVTHARLLYQFTDLRDTIWTFISSGSARTDKEFAEAMINAYVQLLADWQSTLEEFLARLKKAKEKEKLPRVNTLDEMINQIEQVILPDVSQQIKWVSSLSK